jgi:hypothetical protein
MLIFLSTAGGKVQFSRTDFYADGASMYIPQLFEKFDDRAADAFLDSIRENQTLRMRITNPKKLRRLRFLGNLILNKISINYHDKLILKKLNNENAEAEFLKMLKKKTT